MKEEEEFREAHVLNGVWTKVNEEDVFSEGGQTQSSSTDIVGMWKLDELLNVIMSSTQETLLKYLRR